ncbi:MAG: hypothetical protein ACOX5R_12880 [bacterium]
MKVDVNDTIMIVVGSGLVPEEKDRPLAYRLKSRIDPLGKSEYQRSVVVSDIWYLENILFQTCSTVIIGGPGVNEASQHFFNKLPLIWTFEDMAFMQLDQEREIRVSLWGMNQAGTEMALDFFISEYLTRFLSLAWKENG